MQHFHMMTAKPNQASIDDRTHLGTMASSINNEHSKLTTPADGGGIGHINQVTLRRTQLVLGWSRVRAKVC